MPTRRTLAVVAVAALALVACGRGRYETAYPDFVTARQHDAVDRGWIPDFLPETATDLREAHVPEEGSAVVRATLPDEAIPHPCVEVEEVGELALEASWVPEDLGGAPIRCGVWEGRLDGRTLILWTAQAPEDPE